MSIITLSNLPIKRVQGMSQTRRNFAKPFDSVMTTPIAGGTYQNANISQPMVRLFNHDPPQQAAGDSGSSLRNERKGFTPRQP
jgi:hypothetical protein